MRAPGTGPAGPGANAPQRSPNAHCAGRTGARAPLLTHAGLGVLPLPRKHLQRGLHALDALPLHLDFRFHDFLLLPLHADALPEAQGAAARHVLEPLHCASPAEASAPPVAGIRSTPSLRTARAAPRGSRRPGAEEQSAATDRSRFRPVSRPMSIFGDANRWGPPVAGEALGLTLAERSVPTVGPGTYSPPTRARTSHQWRPGSHPHAAGGAPMVPDAPYSPEAARSWRAFREWRRASRVRLHHRCLCRTPPCPRLCPVRELIIHRCRPLRQWAIEHEAVEPDQPPGTFGTAPRRLGHSGSLHRGLWVHASPRQRPPPKLRGPGAYSPRSPVAGQSSSLHRRSACMLRAGLPVTGCSLPPCLRPRACSASDLLPRCHQASTSAAWPPRSDERPSPAVTGAGRWRVATTSPPPTRTPHHRMRRRGGRWAEVEGSVGGQRAV